MRSKNRNNWLGSVLIGTLPLLFLSCGIRTESAKKIGRRYVVEEISAEECIVPVYFSKRGHEQLDGNIKLKGRNGNTIIARFSDGVMNGSYQCFRKRFLHELSTYKNGYRNGESQRWTALWNEELKKYLAYRSTGNFQNGRAEGIHKKFLGDTLLKSSNYKNGLKVGEELYYGESGDTLDRVFYQFIEEAQVTEELRKKIPEKYHSFPVHGKWKISGSKPKLYARLVFLLDVKLIDENCMEDEIFLIEINNQFFAAIQTPFGLSELISL